MHYTIIENQGGHLHPKSDSCSPDGPEPEDLSTPKRLKMEPSSPVGGRSDSELDLDHLHGNEDQENAHLSREERRRRRRATHKYRTAHASRERMRVEAFNVAFADLRRLLPTLPPDKKLSKIEILRLAICYISYLNHVLDLSWYQTIDPRRVGPTEFMKYEQCFYPDVTEKYNDFAPSPHFHPAMDAGFPRCNFE